MFSPKTHAEAVHVDAMPSVKKTKVFIPLLKEKKKKKETIFSLSR